MYVRFPLLHFVPRPARKCNQDRTKVRNADGVRADVTAMLTLDGLPRVRRR